MKTKLTKALPNIITISRIVALILGFIFFIRDNFLISIIFYIYGAVSDAFDVFVLDEFLAWYLLEVFLHLWVLRQIFMRYLVGQVLVCENLTIIEIGAGNDEACLHYVITLLWHSLFFFEFQINFN